MKIRIFCFSLFFITTGIVHAAAVPKKAPKEVPLDVKKIEDFSDVDLSVIVQRFSDAVLARFERLLPRFRKIAQAEFKNRLGAAGYVWARSEIIATPPFHAHYGWIKALIVSNKGELISVGDVNHICAWQWDGETYKQIRQKEDDISSLISFAQFAPKENRLALVHSNNIVNIWDVHAWEKINEFVIDDFDYDIVGFSSDGSTLGVGGASSAVPQVINLWDVMTGKSRQIRTDISGAIYAPIFSPDCKKLAWVSKDKQIIVWNLETNKKKNQFKSREGVLLFLPDGKLIECVINNRSKKLSINDVQTDKQTIIDFSSYAQIGRLFAQNDTILIAEVIVTNEPVKEKIVFWHLESGKVIRELDIPNPINCVALSADYRTLVAGCTNGDILTWRASAY